jgi:hypothetical protein
VVILYIVTAVALTASLIASRQKTLTALKLAAKRLARILPAFLTMLALFAVTITLLPQEVVTRLLGRESGALGVAIARVCRIPMTMFEASFMGGIFTAVRLAVSVPLVIVTAVIMSRFLERRGYQITE